MSGYDCSVQGWKNLPEELLVLIFNSLNHKQLLTCELVCQRWRNIASLNVLWRRRCILDFKIDPDSRNPKGLFWKNEYERMDDQIPRYESKCITEHKDEVLHVSFSNDGKMFCTCSKDRTMKVFDASWPYIRIHSEDFGFSTQFRWQYTQYSQFNKSDTKLLVSGPCCGSKMKGEMAIFTVAAGNFVLTARIPMTPYDAMGYWVNDDVLTVYDTQIVLAFPKVIAFKDPLFSSNDDSDILSYVQVVDMSEVIWKESKDRKFMKDAHAVHQHVLQRLKSGDSTPACNITKCRGIGDEPWLEHKLLLCITGGAECPYHRIGIKAYHDRDTSKLRRYDRPRLRMRGEGLRHGQVDKWGHIIHLNGQAVGMALSPCNRYLFVNVRKSEAPGSSISTNISLCMYDLLTMRELKRFTGHKAFSTEPIFFINVGCNEHYVVSGAENKAGYLWDRHYGVVLTTFRHNKTVNCVAVSQSVPGMAVSASDDRTIKVWQSKSWVRDRGKL